MPAPKWWLMVNSGSKDPTPFSGLCRYQALMWYTDIRAGKTPILIKLK